MALRLGLSWQQARQQNRKPQLIIPLNMKRTLKLLGAAFVAAAWTGVVLAGNYTNNFDLGDPTTNSIDTGFLIKANAARSSTTNKIWFPYDGHTLLTYQNNATDTTA